MRGRDAFSSVRAGSRAALELAPAKNRNHTTNTASVMPALHDEHALEHGVAGIVEAPATGDWRGTTR